MRVLIDTNVLISAGQSDFKNGDKYFLESSLGNPGIMTPSEFVHLRLEGE